jgi:hypothetical protein
MDEKLEQRANIKFCVKLGKSGAETFEMIRRAYENLAMCRATCFEWFARFKRCRTSLEDDDRSGRPSTNSTPKNVETIRDCAPWICPQGQTINAQFYCNVLRRLWEDIRRKRPELWRAGNWMIHDDNAPSHRALVTREFLVHNSVITLPHQPYSPDLAPCDFFFFPNMKLKLKDRRFDRPEEIQRESQNVFVRFENRTSSTPRHF